jgi:ubiquinone/menaquinone biosynthesis C-methylase UbiE|uniref:class I SAM-dependent methyltransferase n=1 Tax=Cephaloticoccus sp. TaxID=1985742 RepID=UPI004049CE3C
MNPSSRSFDRLAGIYRALEFLAFGRDLERTRFGLLPHLQDRRTILVLGEGDGRFLERLLTLNPTASIDCLDVSAGMLARTKGRLGEKAGRVNFIHADVTTTEFSPGRYDAVVTCFLLDCFNPAQTRSLISRVVSGLQPGALWLWADFVLPDHGPARWRAQIWLAGLYTFFHWQTGLRNRTLPPSEALLAGAGLVPLASVTRQWGLLRTSVYRLTAI